MWDTTLGSEIQRAQEDRRSLDYKGRNLSATRHGGVKDRKLGQLEDIVFRMPE